MGDKCQNQQLTNPWQYPPPYGIYNPYANQPYGHTGYGRPGQYFYGYSGMGYNPNGPQCPNGPNNQNVPQMQGMNHAMSNKSFPSDFGQQNSAISNNPQDSNDKKLGDRNDLPPLPPGPPPPPPLSGHNYSTPVPPGTSLLRPQFYGQTNNTYNPVKFNLANKKTGLGFKPFNSGGGNKKKRKKNKNNQFNNSFNNSMVGNSPLFLHPPPLPPPEAAPPPFPPLPPLPQEPAPPTPPSEDPPQDEGMDPGKIVKPMETNADTPFSVTTKTLEERASAAVSNSQTQQKTLSTPTAPFNPSGDWPESLKKYVNRCYAKCVENVDKDQVEIILKGKITRAANEGSLWIKNWDNEPLPSGSSSTPQKQQSGGRGKKSGLSAAMGSRLGVRSYRRRSRSRSRSRTRSHSRSPSLSRSRRNRSRSSDSSRSPVRRRRTRSDSSSSSDENFKPLKVTKNRGGSRVADRLSLKGRNGNKNKGKGRQNNKGAKSHFYSEFGLNSDELGSSERLQQRAARFNSSLKSNMSITSVSPITPQRRKKPLSLVTTINNMNIIEDLNGDIDWSEFHVVGTCQDIEKPYLRLTSAPDASIVRPVDVLKSSIKKVKDRWVESQDYCYACDQMKSIRQDLTVQGIRDSFTVEVYETHARIALEKGDHEEFNQCQTQLKMLYSEIGGANRLEFTAYRILYYIFTKNTLDLTTILASLTPEDKTDECVAHALAVRSAWWLGNYHRLFKLYTEAPRMAGYLVDWFVDRERKAAIKCLIKSYRPFLPLSFVVQELAFDSDEKCLEFITPFGLTFEDIQRTKIDCKASLAALNTV
ncbi:leukocyte receptor cluster member 8 homolog isoform X2 [Zootermopsis nevadensis]|uniref:leukocyte receptor cluster member 8 homolog isoform X2 n=1 Tax=Zootermopsis nevadensis TaxID=136037 RepID=UPI000B8E4A6D|nr:leukocyte receptor cluster member 8 homolog isoform X2 [Zootermopsis nevadensis]